MNEKLEVLPKEDALTPSIATGMDIATSRQAQEVQAAMVVAKKFPRNETVAISRIMGACQRLTLAESALYAYPRGGTTVTGPSIRLAEALAKNWGNVDSGVIELEQKHGESVVMAYCWDLETNTRSTKIFTVKHERKAGGEIKVLTDPRDIYEMTANQGARRLRACILSIIPGDVTEMAVDACEKTMKEGDKAPFAERMAKVITFLKQFNVNVPQIEKRLGHKIDSANETELVTLRKICKTLDDNAGKPEDYFDFSAVGKSEPSKPQHTTGDGDLGPQKTAAPAQSPAPTEPKKRGRPAKTETQPVAAPAAPASVAQTPPTEPTEPPANPDEPPFEEPPGAEVEAAKMAEEAEVHSLVEQIGKLAADSKVTEDQVVAFCKANRMMAGMSTQLSDMTVAKLKLLVSNWQFAVQNIAKFSAT